MIEARAQVVDLRGDRVRVRVDAGRGGCGRCNEPGGCGGARLSELFGPNRNEFEIENTIGALRGEEVVLCIAEDASLKAALVGYGLPVVCVIAGAAVGTALAGSGSQDAWALFGALAGVALQCSVEGACGVVKAGTASWKCIAPPIEKCVRIEAGICRLGG